MKKIRLKQAENSVASKQSPEVSPEQDKQNREIAANMLLAVVEKMQNLPAVPVAESLDDLMKQFDKPKRAPVVINHLGGRRIRYDSGGNAEIITPEKSSDENPTLYESSGAEKSSDENPTFDKTGAFNTTGFDAEQLALLKRIQENG